MYFRDSIVDEVCGVDVEQLLGREFVALVTWRFKALGLVTTSRQANEREQLKRRGKRLPSAAHVWKLELDERNDEEEDLPEKCSKVSLEKKKPLCTEEAYAPQALFKNRPLGWPSWPLISEAWLACARYHPARPTRTTLVIKREINEL